MVIAVGLELLPGFGGVLGVQRGDLFDGEVADPDRLDGDVEGARAAQPGGVTAGRGLVVADVPHPAQHDRGGERLRPVIVAVAELVQHAAQHEAVQGVDLVEEQHQRQRAGDRPVLQGTEDQAACSHETVTATWRPSAVRCRLRVRSVVVFPVCRGACTMKYCQSSMSRRPSGRRGSGGSM